jgi:hypothetical protein
MCVDHISHCAEENRDLRLAEMTSLIVQRPYLAGRSLKCLHPGIPASRSSSCVVEAGLGESMKKFMDSVVIHLSNQARTL